MIKCIKLNVWGREYILEVYYDCCENEEPLENQIRSFEFFVNNMDLIEKSRHYVENYCRRDVLSDNNHKKDNIFSYVKPDYLLIKREEENPRVALMCDYRYDMEHGLAIVFSCNGSIEVGTQDMIL